MEIGPPGNGLNVVQPAMTPTHLAVKMETELAQILLHNMVEAIAKVSTQRKDHVIRYRSHAQVPNRVM